MPSFPFSNGVEDVLDLVEKNIFRDLLLLGLEYLVSDSDLEEYPKQTLLNWNTKCLEEKKSTIIQRSQIKWVMLWEFREGWLSSRSTELFRLISDDKYYIKELALSL